MSNSLKISDSSIHRDSDSSGIKRKSPYTPRRATPLHEPVVIAERPLKGGGASLVLRYRIGGKRQTEFLRLYLVPEVTKTDKVKNLHTMEKARLIQAERHVQLVRGDLRTPEQVEEARVAGLGFYEWIEQLMKEKRGSTLQSWKHALMYVRRYDPNDNLLLCEVSERWLQGFRNFLDTSARAWSIDGRKRSETPKGLEEGTKALYLRKICSALTVAYRRGYIKRNPAVTVPKFRPEEQDRVYLTIEELRALVATPCHAAIVKEAFLFCCLTGLRWSDMVKLKWEDITEATDGPTLTIRQTKTGRPVRVALNSQAQEILKVMRSISEGHEVFGSFMSDSVAGYHLKIWAANAGIRKKVSWHVSRHTFAMQLLDRGVELYTISKLMGHSDLKTTQIYAQIRDHHRRDAVDRLPDIL